MNAYEALNAAADAIEARPEDYNFSVGRVGPTIVGGRVACMLGHLGRVVGGYTAGTSVGEVSERELGVDAEIFYRQIIEATNGKQLARNEHINENDYRALCDVATVPNAMRKVAHEHYRTIPQKIREIFTEKEVA